MGSYKFNGFRLPYGTSPALKTRKLLLNLHSYLPVKRPDSSVGRATDWKSVCRWFNSTSGHRLIISDISILSYIILVLFEELNKFYKVLQAVYWAINPQPSSTLVLQNASTPSGYPPTLLFRERHNLPKKNPTYTIMLNNLEKQIPD